MATDPMSMSLDDLIAKNRSSFKANRGKRKATATQKPKKQKQVNSRGGHGGRGSRGGRGGRGGLKSSPGRKKTEFVTRKQRQGFKSGSAKRKEQQQAVRSQKAQNKTKTQEKLFTGALVEIDPLNPDIIKDDIRELCTNIGEVKSINLRNSRRVESRSKGAIFKRAEVRFRRKKDAEEAVRKLHKRALDDTVMNVMIKK